MSTAAVFSGDVQAQGIVSCKAVSVTTACLNDDAMKTDKPITSPKLQHRRSLTLQLFGPTTTVAALTQWLATILGATAKVVNFAAVIAVQATGGDRTITVDLQRSTGGGAFATVMSATISITNGTVIRTQVTGTLNGGSVSMVVGDILQAVVTVAGAAGAQAQGLTITLVFDEDAQ